MKKLKIQLLFKYLLVILNLLSIYNIYSFNKSYKYNKKILNKGIITKINYKDNYDILDIKSKYNTRAYIYKNTNLNIGDIISFNYQFKDINENLIPNTFNYKKYLKSINISNIIVINKYKKISNNKYYMCKGKFINLLEKKESKKYIFTFLLADKSYLDLGVKESYINNGISHLFCVSGFHILFLLSFLKNVFRKIIKNENTISIILIFFSFIYLINTDFMIPIFRATLLYFMNDINKKYNFNINKYLIFLFILNISIIIKPYSVYNVSFWYTYILSFFLIKYNNKLETSYKFINIFFITSYAFAISLPLTIYVNYKVSIISIIYSTLFSVIVCYILYPLSFIALLNNKVDKLLFYLSNRFERINIYLSNKNILKLIFPKFSIYILIVLYIVLFLFTNKYKLKYLLIYFIILISIYFSIYFDNKSYVYYLDVGQGDASLIINKKHKNVVMIDTGGIVDNNYLSNNIITFLNSLGVRRIDNLILTHGDYDHMGNAFNIINNVKVNKVIFNCGSYSNLEKELINLLNNKNINYDSCINKVDNLSFLNTRIYDNENDNSNVIYTEIYGYKFMFMGDAGVDKEKDILNKFNISNIDYLKVGHHGSKTSSSKKFIESIKPKNVVISVGNNNRYGHPNKEVLDVLKDSKIYRTDEDGSIMFKIKNNKLKVETCNP